MTVWQIEELTKVQDGDSIIATLLRTVDDDGERQLTERRWDVRLRLVTVDTPELGKPGGKEAREHTAVWLGYRPLLDVETYKRDSFGRTLGDVYVRGKRGETLTQWLMRDCGWPPYVRG